MNICYFIGIFWIILVNYSHKGESEDNDDFINKFGIDNLYKSVSKAEADARFCLISFYFSFTSLSTVGFGDYHPRSNLERGTTAGILLIGVAVFSYILGNFIDILNDI
jgi:hypothetical protein